MTKRNLLAIIAILAAVAGAAAADLPTLRRSIPPPEPAVFSWTGVYVGGQLGYSWGRDRTKEFFTATGGYTGAQWAYKENSAFGGLHIGANYQVGAMVLGAELDGDLMNAKGGFDDPGGYGRFKQTSQGTARARLGYAFGPTMIYATGGAAFSRLSYTYINPLGDSEKSEGVRTGYVIGAGVEHAFTQNISARLEYRHTDYGTFEYVAQSAFLGLTGTQKPTSDSLRASASYRF